MVAIRQGLWALLVLAMAVPAAAEQAAPAAPQVLLETSLGTITVELAADKAPNTVANFLDYVDQGFYNGTVFHRIIEDFMIQGGGFTADYRKKPTGKPVRNEADNGLSNRRGTLAMARTRDPHSATAQFFINTVDNGNLDHTGKSASGWGYTVFGRVIDGLDVVDAIAATPTGRGTLDGYPTRDVPVMPVTIKRITRVTSANNADAQAAPAP